MFSSRKQKNNSSKLTCLLFLSILSSNVLSAPTSELKKSPSASSSKKIKSLDDPQHPSELAWGALLLVDSSILDSPSPPRRITPKSIFIAPPLQTCAEGYQPDSMNRCVKDVNINQEAYFDFLLQRLNAMYGNLGNPQQSDSSSSSSSSSSNGSLEPFQLNIPIIINSNKESSNLDNTSEKAPVSTFDDKRPENETKKQETIITVYEIEEPDNNNSNNKTKPHNDDKSPENDQLIPVVEIIETNSNGSEIIDYTIPIQLYNVTNNTDSKNSTVISNKEENPLNESSSTLVLILSPTKLLSNITEDSNKIKNQSLDKDIVNVRNTSMDEEINVSLPEYTVTTTLSPIKIFLNSSTSTPSSSSSSLPSVSTNTNTDYEDTSQVTDEDRDVIYNDNDNNKEAIDYNTAEDLEEHDLEDHTEDLEDFTESDDEILKHSEAGMAVTLPSRFYTTSSLTTLDDQNNNDDNEKISSEVHVNRDFIRETTLVGLNYDKNNSSTIVDKEIQSTTPLDDEYDDNNEDITEVTTITEEIPEFETQSSVSLVDKTFDPLDNINPVITIEEASLTGFIDRKTTTTPETTTFKPTTMKSTTPFIVYPSQTVKNIISQTVKPIYQPDNTEIMAASSSNTAETVVHEVEPQKPIVVKPTVDKTHKEIFINGPITEPKEIETVSQNKQTFDYDPAPQVSNFGSHNSEDNPIIKTIDDQRIELNKNPVNFFPNNNFQSSYNPPRDYIRFPSYDQSPNRPNYVRFPSEEANSIHTDDSKDRYHSHYPPGQNNRITTAKVGGFKRPLWPIPPTWRLDRQHLREKSDSHDDDQKQSESTPMLMRFWKRMPLILDPSLINDSSHPTFPQTSSQSETNERTGRSYSSRRINYYQEMSPQDVTQSFARIQR
ncbi:probable serine/threonine-protein kinase DDB_G0282963 [Microplitis demolitor]|uniref:probable serine/threonine-protein kinase DDB_G0282963 n=1 Tax=Microplitis demolitor TaxID=69319 RepID=UPI0004CD2AC3|nr:probable serine/threonine-protein kinase DDB_G0282963 [Microplitis demolitor]XP_008543735.1 probable serine/threonine-protein kinase DDB_G0282963 [Microplitis demolitor]XP_008543736.1 probable serine/threonine-protein kinase DDB_G0282963 [Microplitis demolitor]XP_053593436.1 probable serine/threonine-protein kinase DDB_G0282963 [Microplitis demolitor]XP_053593437.1 probable serine/threonine-protein kinase DDB_G0282963 [Microplitis demolitor]